MAATDARASCTELCQMAWSPEQGATPCRLQSRMACKAGDWPGFLVAKRLTLWDRLTLWERLTLWRSAPIEKRAHRGDFAFAGAGRQRHGFAGGQNDDRDRRLIAIVVIAGLDPNRGDIFKTNFAR